MLKNKTKQQQQQQNKQTKRRRKKKERKEKKKELTGSIWMGLFFFFLEFCVRCLFMYVLYHICVETSFADLKEVAV